MEGYSYNAESRPGTLDAFPMARQSEGNDGIDIHTEVFNSSANKCEFEDSSGSFHGRLRKLLAKRAPPVGPAKESNSLLKQHLDNALPRNSSSFIAEPSFSSSSQFGNNSFDKFNQDPVDNEVPFESSQAPVCGVNASAPLMPKISSPQEVKESWASQCLRDLLVAKGLSSELSKKKILSDISPGSKFPLLLQSLVVKRNDLDIPNNMGQPASGTGTRTLTHNFSSGLAGIAFARNAVYPPSFTTTQIKATNQNANYVSKDTNIIFDRPSEMLSLEASYALRKRGGAQKMGPEPSYLAEFSDVSDQEDNDQFYPYYDKDDLDDDYSPGIEGSDSEGEHQCPTTSTGRRKASKLNKREPNKQLPRNPPKIRKSRGKQAVSVLEQLTAGQNPDGKPITFEEGYAFRKRSKTSGAEILKLVSSESDFDSSDDNGGPACNYSSSKKRKAKKSSDSGEEYEPKKQQRKFQKRKRGKNTRLKSLKRVASAPLSETRSFHPRTSGSTDAIGPACSTLLQLASKFQNSSQKLNEPIPGPNDDVLDSGSESYRILKLLLETPSNVDLAQIKASIDTIGQSSPVESGTSSLGGLISSNPQSTEVLPESNRSDSVKHDDMHSPSSSLSLLKMALSAPAEQSTTIYGDESFPRLGKDTKTFQRSYFGSDNSVDQDQMLSNESSADYISVKTEPKSPDQIYHCDADQIEGISSCAKHPNFEGDHVRVKTEPFCHEFVNSHHQSDDINRQCATDSIAWKNVTEAHSPCQPMDHGNFRTDPCDLNTGKVKASGSGRHDVKIELQGPVDSEIHFNGYSNGRQFRNRTGDENWPVDPVFIKPEPKSPEGYSDMEDLGTKVKAEPTSPNSQVRHDNRYRDPELTRSENQRLETHHCQVTGDFVDKDVNTFLSRPDVNMSRGTSGSNDNSNQSESNTPSPTLPYLKTASSDFNVHDAEAQSSQSNYAKFKTDPMDVGFESSVGSAYRHSMSDKWQTLEFNKEESVSRGMTPRDVSSTRIHSPMMENIVRNIKVDAVEPANHEDPYTFGPDSSLFDSHPKTGISQTNLDNNWYRTGGYDMASARTDFGPAQIKVEPDFVAIDDLPRIQNAFPSGRLSAECYYADVLREASFNLPDTVCTVDDVMSDSNVEIMSFGADKPSRSVGDRQIFTVPYLPTAQFHSGTSSATNALQMTAANRSSIGRAHLVQYSAASQSSANEQSSARSALQFAAAQSAIKQGSAMSALQLLAKCKQASKMEGVKFALSPDSVSPLQQSSPTLTALLTDAFGRKKC